MQTRGGDVQFGARLYEMLRQALSESIILARYCLVGGMPALSRLVQNRLENLTRGVNPLIQQWMASTTTAQLNTFVPSIRVTEEQIMHYVVKKEKTPSPEAPMETSPVVQSPGASAVVSPQSMEVEIKHDSKSSPSGAANVVKKAVSVTTSPGAAAVEEQVLNGATGGGPSTSSEGDTSWQKEIPEEWVPIINGDIKKQKQQKHQPPFSDAYYQGMPAKRRKLNQPFDASNPGLDLTQSIRRAVASASVEPISSIENLTKEIEDNAELLNEYEEHTRNSIIDRLQTDSDFVPDRFPKSHEYFKGNNKK